MVSLGMTCSEIADTIYVTIHTVKAHLSSIYYKLNVHNKTQAVVKAIRTNLIEI